MADPDGTLCNNFDKINMADPDDMDVEDWRDDKFKVPDPPRKPDFLQGIDNMHWAQFSRRLAATLNDDKTGFDVKLYDPSGPTPDPTTRDPDPSITPWYRLGPPSAIPDYPVLIEKYGSQVLEAAGFIDHDFSPPSNNINGRLASEIWRPMAADRTIETRIHAALGRGMWHGITDHQYSLMHPALLLATAILDDPVTLNYFYALAEPAASMDTVSHASAGLQADCKIMKIPDTLNDDQQMKTGMKLIMMIAYLDDWGFDDIDMGCLAHTQRVHSPEGGPEIASKP